MTAVSEKKPDGVRLALLNNRLQGVARKMANTLLRTGRSGVLNIARDFSCAIVTRDHDLLRRGKPAHSRAVGSRPDVARDEGISSQHEARRRVPA
jgi:hypothetical protein